MGTTGVGGMRMLGFRCTGEASPRFGIDGRWFLKTRDRGQDFDHGDVGTREFQRDDVVMEGGSRYGP